MNADSPAVVAGADSTVEGQAEQLFASDPTGGATGVGHETFESQPPAVIGQPDRALCTHGFHSEGVGRLGAITTGVVKHTGGHSGETTGIRYLLSKFTDINAMTKAQSMLICWSRTQPLSDIRIRLESWLKIFHNPKDFSLLTISLRCYPKSSSFVEFVALGAKTG